MPVEPNSLLNVFMNLREFFAKKMNRDEADLDMGTNVRKDGNFSDAAWSTVRYELAALPWMKKYGVDLSAREMNVLWKLSDLANVIWDEINNAKPAPQIITSRTKSKTKKLRKTRKKRS